MFYSLFKATHTKTVGLIVIVHVAVATVEVQVPAVGSAVLSTAPVVAVAASVVQRAIAVVEVAGGKQPAVTITVFPSRSPHAENERFNTLPPSEQADPPNTFGEVSP